MQNKFLKIIFGSSIVIIGLMASTLVLAQQKESAQMQGEKLTRLWWENMQSKNMNAVEKTISPSFQSIGSSGIVDREKFISIVSHADLSPAKPSKDNIKN